MVTLGFNAVARSYGDRLQKCMFFFHEVTETKARFKLKNNLTYIVRRDILLLY